MNEYIKQVKRELSVPRGRKKEVLRDLEEAFASAKEHGESEAEVIARLGTPQEFAEQFGTDGKVGKEKLIAILCTTFAVIVALTALAVAYAPAIFQRGNPFPYLKSAWTLRFAPLDSVDDDTRAGEVYMMRSGSDISQMIWHISMEYGMELLEQEGSAYIFQGSGVRMTVNTEVLWGKYLVWDIPAIHTQEKSYFDYYNSSDTLMDKFGGFTPEQIHSYFGEPQGTLSGFYGDVYVHDNIRLIFYYDYCEEDGEAVFRVSNITRDETESEAIETPAMPDY